MSNEAEIIQKRKEVQQEILRMKEKIPLSLLFNWLGRPFKRDNLAYWVLNVILLNLILASPWVLLGFALNETWNFVAIWVPYMLGFNTTIFGVIVGNFIIRYVFDNFAGCVVQKMNSMDDLSELLIWFKKTWSVKSVITFALRFCALWAFLAVGGFSIGLHRFVGFGVLISSAFTGMLAGVGSQMVIWIILFIFRLKNYEYELNVFSPADSQVIADISRILTNCTYSLAAWFFIVTLLGTSSLVEETVRFVFSFPLIFLGWVMTITQFYLTRATLGAIVNKAKWKTLNKLQAQINELETTGDLSDRETAERFLRLADIHKQIMASKIYIFNPNSVLTLLSQLMLPLLGLLLGNLDRILKLFP